jgi:hypothetical protein
MMTAVRLAGLPPKGGAAGGITAPALTKRRSGESNVSNRLVGIARERRIAGRMD